jgi:hypothetical protein
LNTPNSPPSVRHWAYLPNMHVLRTMIKATELFATTEGENETLPHVTTINSQNERYEKKTRDCL